MKRLVLLMALTACTKHVDLGEECAKADECGNGSDCYHGVCTPMCADDSECTGELVCARHRCLLATGEPKRVAPPEDRANPQAYEVAKVRPGFRENTPERRGDTGNPSQDVLAELKAIRAELQQIRAEQQRLQESIDKLKP